MTNAEVHEELLQLRKQVAALAESRRRQNAKAAHDREDAEEPGNDASEQTIRDQIEELTRLFQDEIREMPALPTLAVFMLGVLVGRYLR